MHRLAEVWRPGGDGPPGSKTINESGGKTGGEAGIRTLGRAFGPYNGLANRRLQPLGHLTLRLASLAQGEPQTLSVREISTCGIQLFLSNVQRFFEPPPSSNSPGKSPDFAIIDPRTLGTLMERPENPGRADGARRAAWRFRSMSQAPFYDGPVVMAQGSRRVGSPVNRVLSLPLRHPDVAGGFAKVEEQLIRRNGEIQKRNCRVHE
jgi:hypothetical protein